MSKFIQSLFAFITALWSKGKHFIENYVEESVEFVQRVKLMLDKPAADFIVSVIPGIADDKALAWLRKVLPGVIKSLGVISDLNDDDDIIKWLQTLIAHINMLSEMQRAGFYRDLACLLSIEKAKLDQFKHIDSISRSRANLAVEMQYLKITDTVED